MLNCDDLPEDNQALGGILIDLPRLPDDSPISSPAGLAEILRYLGLEVPGGTALMSDDLAFRRTAEMGDARYWIWSFIEPDGGQGAYVTVREGADGTIELSYDTDYYGLSPEQFVLGDYCGCW